ncbi:MAG: PD40 domain-containing protein, partial [Planctomycetaceae bacterium]|nr:PD40 domain-containing protein [Planctomycetaceae bacterium]
MKLPCRSLLSLLTVCVVCWLPTATQAEDELKEQLAQVAKNLQHHYDGLNTDGQEGLTLAEFLKRKMSEKQKRRDFALFDFNGDALISKSELSAIPGVVAPFARAEIPSPYADIREHALSSMEIAFGWEEQPQLRIQSNVFAVGYLESLGVSSAARNEIVAQADANGDGAVELDELEDFVDQQLILQVKGVELHSGNGLVLNYSLFMSLDGDKDGVVSREEFLTRYYDKKVAAERFPLSDLDGNGSMTLEEFAHPLKFGWTNPVGEFVKCDADFDGELTTEELAAGLPAFLQRLAPFLIPSFDTDKNGKLNLAEYRFSPVANRVIVWQGIRSDANRNQRLEFEEFAQDASLLLLRRLYFQRFDVDGSGALTPDEYFFKYTPDDAFYTLAADGSSFEKLYSSADTSYCGSQAVSPDGKWIAFDGRPAESSFSDTVIYVMAADGTGRRVVCDGSMPTWSPDGKYLACSRSGRNSGVWFMKSDGSEPKLISEDGWGAQWSPDGKSIAFTLGAQIALYKVETREIEVVIGQGGHPYQYIYYNMAWSPDSKRVCFKGRK